MHTLSSLWKDGGRAPGVGVGFRLLLLDTDCGESPFLHAVIWSGVETLSQIPRLGLPWRRLKLIQSPGLR